jgi:hypothetical protein
MDRFEDFILHYHAKASKEAADILDSDLRGETTLGVRPDAIAGVPDIADSAGAGVEPDGDVE